jgi:uncharacterized protein (TIGR02246 family)
MPLQTPRLAIAALTLLGLLTLTAASPPSPTREDPMPTTQATLHDEEATIVALLRGYESALNARDVETIVSLYATDGVFMAQGRPPNVGSAQIEAAYTGVFEMITLDITFEIDEVEVVTPTMAWARTRSAGKTTILATGAVVSEGNQELFLLLRPDANAPWKIGRYIFSTTQPPA